MGDVRVQSGLKVGWYAPQGSDPGDKRRHDDIVLGKKIGSYKDEARANDRADRYANDSRTPKHAYGKAVVVVTIGKGEDARHGVFALARKDDGESRQIWVADGNTGMRLDREKLHGKKLDFRLEMTSPLAGCAPFAPSGASVVPSGVAPVPSGASSSPSGKCGPQVKPGAAVGTFAGPGADPDNKADREKAVIGEQVGRESGYDSPKEANRAAIRWAADTRSKSHKHGEAVVVVDGRFLFKLETEKGKPIHKSEGYKDLKFSKEGVDIKLVDTPRLKH